MASLRERTRLRAWGKTTAMSAARPIMNWPATSTRCAGKYWNTKMASTPAGTIPKSGDAATTP